CHQKTLQLLGLDDPGLWNGMELSKYFKDSINITIKPIIPPIPCFSPDRVTFSLVLI
ncbi:hypothetical protein AVEN_50230-1, partial [Araneus ventricosus]